jgi:arylsulfatase A-like enzyme
VRTPGLDRLFRHGVQYSEAFAASATTLASHTSILSGAWPTTHGVIKNRMRVPDALVSLAEILSDAGFATGAFVSSAALDARLNLAQGFDVYDFRPTALVRFEQPWRPSTVTFPRALEWWRGQSGPRFLWVHAFEPHFPYEPAPELAELYDPGYTGHIRGDMETLVDIWGNPTALSEEDFRHLRALYWAEITGMDRTIGRFLRELERDPSTLVVVIADHGESLGDHHDLYFKHGPHVYPSDVAVPLAVRAPGVEPAVTSAMVRTIDIPRTILERVGIEAELPEEAGELLRWRDGGEGFPSFGMASQPWAEATRATDNKLQRVVRTQRMAYVETPWEKRRELFDRQADPGEMTTLPVRGPEYEALHAALDAWIAGAGRPAEQVTDPEVLERLESLGYID